MPVLPPPGTLSAPWEIYIKYLPHETEEASLQEFLAANCGPLSKGVVLMKDAEGWCKGAGWATFVSEESMREALLLDGTEYGGRHIQVTVAKQGVFNGAKLDAPTGTVQEAGTHTPALCNDVVRELIGGDPSGLFVDATFGRGGHTRAMLASLSKRGRLHAFDMDPEAIAAGADLSAADGRFKLHHASFSSMASVPELHGNSTRTADSDGEALVHGTNNEGEVAGALFDLGISSPQLDGDRGFRPEQDAELDMRFDTSCGKPAWCWLKRATRDEMARVFHELGGEDTVASQRIADAVALVRGPTGKTVPKRTREFADLVQRAKGGKDYQAMHPAKPAFQALRIHVNREFDELRDGMLAGLQILRSCGRLGLITWKHKECAIVVEFLRQHEIARADHPLLQWYEANKGAGGKLAPRWGLLQEDSIRPSAEELRTNSRSRSAVLHLLRKHRGILLPQLEAVAYTVLGWPSKKQEDTSNAEAVPEEGETKRKKRKKQKRVEEDADGGC